MDETAAAGVGGAILVLAGLIKELHALPWYQAGGKDYDEWLRRVAEWLIAHGVYVSATDKK